jgi:hypothetical protein
MPERIDLRTYLESRIQATYVDGSRGPGQAEHFVAKDLIGAPEIEQGIVEGEIDKYFTRVLGLSLERGSRDPRFRFLSSLGVGYEVEFSFVPRGHRVEAVAPHRFRVSVSEINQGKE